MRVAFLGPAPTTAVHALHDPVADVEPVFLDARPAADPERLRAALARAAPDVVVLLAPDELPFGVLEGLPAAHLVPGRPLPIDDRVYADVASWRRPPRALFLGRSTEHRERMLIASKHEHDLLHYAHGLTGNTLRAVLAQADVGVALTRDGPPGFPPQALLHLAAGHLLVAEPLNPALDLTAGRHLLEVSTPAELLTVLRAIRTRPENYDEVRDRGRRSAEAHRASVVWPRILAGAQIP